MAQELIGRGDQPPRQDRKETAMTLFVRLALVAALSLVALTAPPAFAPTSFAAKADCSPNCL